MELQFVLIFGVHVPMIQNYDLFYKEHIQIATHNPINSNLLKIKQKCLHSISNIAYECKK